MNNQNGSTEPLTTNKERNRCAEQGNATWEFPETYYDPPPATIAALEFQVACLVDDRHSTVTWPGRKPIVVNEPGGLAKKQRALIRIATSLFPQRGDCEDVLSETTLSYGLVRWTNPVGFWTAFKHDMFDAKKTAFEATRVAVERAQSSGTHRNGFEWTPSSESLAMDGRSGQGWLAKRAGEVHALEPTKNSGGSLQKRLLGS